MRLSNKDSRTAVLLGATKGIGMATALELGRTGWRAVIVGRDRAAGEALVATLGHGARFLAADLSSMSSIRGLVAELRDIAPRIDLVVHSADVLRSSRIDTPEGIEASFATNFLGRVLFNRLAEPSLAANATLVHVAAAGFPGRFEVEDIPPQPRESAGTAHNLGQRANDAYGLELANRSRGLRVFVLHPGMVDTNIRRSQEPSSLFLRLLVALLGWLSRPWTVSPENYARRLVTFLAHPPSDTSQVLFGPSFRPIVPRARFRNASFRDAVWRRAHEAVGLPSAGGVDPTSNAIILDT
jgi:NAD(P)-dependent dehydrogenase (short-subunit alcohol dehydrogenase family)